MHGWQTLVLLTCRPTLGFCLYPVHGFYPPLYLSLTSLTFRHVPLTPFSHLTHYIYSLSSSHVSLLLSSCTHPSPPTHHRCNSSLACLNSSNEIHSLRWLSRLSLTDKW